MVSDGAYPWNTVREVGIHHGWGHQSIAGHHAHLFTATDPSTGMVLEGLRKVKNQEKKQWNTGRALYRHGTDIECMVLYYTRIGDQILCCEVAVEPVAHPENSHHFV